jgi:hypothetical protein
MAKAKRDIRREHARRKRAKRDFRREYARRKRNALARGFTTAQARGHARTKTGEAPISTLRDAAKERIQSAGTRLSKAQELIDAGLPKSKAFKEARTSARTYKKYNLQYKFEDGVLKQRQFTFYARGRGIVEEKPLDADNARVVAEYMANVEWARRNKDYDRLLHYEGRIVYDMRGVEYRLEHDLRVIEALEKRADERLRDKTSNPYVKIVLYARAA